LNQKSVKPKISLTLRQSKLIKTNDWNNFLTVFNEVHNSTLTTSVGIVSVLTKSKNEK
jgi:hypothetical protein